jgi:hypothetical protein
LAHGTIARCTREEIRMADLQRMVYASRATFAPSRQGNGIDVEVARILMQSRRNNPRRGLVGALYYGDGAFFQCLEGEPAAIDEVYVPNATAIQALMARHGRKHFDPYTFDEALISAMLDLLRQGADADLLQHDASGSRSAGDRAPQASATIPGRRRATLWFGLGVIVAILAIAAVLFLRHR